MERESDIDPNDGERGPLHEFAMHLAQHVTYPQLCKMDVTANDCSALWDRVPKEGRSYSPYITDDAFRKLEEYHCNTVEDRYGYKPKTPMPVSMLLLPSPSNGFSHAFSPAKFMG
ncbi:hypothetical protein BAUCODRAFT_27762 [Baudoinia panamericana UAMH 10762]|uniref:Uncharacterized protein n=1 Tax=Baudoinia panamericana (strain UAMH 10762) TaxID=717646 RepID=M2LER8_BAUPA|nr:uncharacterized protein BAUCODRAFT_27762 [Baudoinia panamericana UAMH 10762]EMC92487.1 hypothetical protein BAUCODRAFT_27762 [Baudoinia panamericana UAMH 10762]